MCDGSDLWMQLPAACMCHHLALTESSDILGAVETVFCH